jgi:hypothetical protein
MQRSSRQRGLFLLAILFAAGPFVAALTRALGTGTDFRMLLMAIPAFLIVGAIMAFGNAPSRKASGVLTLSVVAFVVAAVVAASVAYLLGARANFGVWAVAIVFALFFATGSALHAFSRTSTS